MVKDVLDGLKVVAEGIKNVKAIESGRNYPKTTPAQGAELARFNNDFIHSKTDAQLLCDQIEDLRTVKEIQRLAMSLN